VGETEKSRMLIQPWVSVSELEAWAVMLMPMLMDQRRTASNRTETGVRRYHLFRRDGKKDLPVRNCDSIHTNLSILSGVRIICKEPTLRECLDWGQVYVLYIFFSIHTLEWSVLVGSDGGICMREIYSRDTNLRFQYQFEFLQYIMS